MVTDAKVENPMDSLSTKDGTSAGDSLKPSGASDKVSTPIDEQKLTEMQKFAEEYANKKHSKLDKTIHNLTTERDTFRKQLDELTAKYEELSQSNFNSKKQEELEAARQSGDPEKIKAVEAHYKTISDVQTAKATLADLNAQIEANRDLLERFNEMGKQAKAKELEESTGVPAELILKLYNEQELTEVEQMENLAENLKGYVAKKAGEEPAKLPHPDKVQGIVPGEMSEEEKLKVRYPKMYSK